jgi:hypothetical protein
LDHFAIIKKRKNVTKVSAAAVIAAAEKKRV